MTEVYADRCVRVELDEGSGIVRFTRSEIPYATNTEIVAIHEQIARELDRLGRDRRSLLVDLRRAPMNHDPAFEEPAERARALLQRGFSRVAVLVQTAIGALQVRRHVREDGRDIGVFSREQDALDDLAIRLDIEGAPKSGVGALDEGPFRSLGRRAARR